MTGTSPFAVVETVLGLNVCFRLRRRTARDRTAPPTTSSAKVKCTLVMPEALGYSLENNIRGIRMQLLKRLVTAAALPTSQARLFHAFSGDLAAVALAVEAAVA